MPKLRANRGKTILQEVRKLVTLGSEAKRKVRDYRLTRYACYLTRPKWRPPPSPSSPAAKPTSPFQTRRQELADNEAFQQLDEDKKAAFFLRNELKEHNKQLVANRQSSGR